MAEADTLNDTAIEQLGIENADDGFLMLFLATPLLGGNLNLTRVREETGGNVYCWDQQNMEGWLCPPLLKYLDTAPADVWVQLKSAW